MSADIHNLGDPTTHFWLTRSVARVMGINLSEAMDANRLSAQGYADLVNHCRRCPYVETCQQWLGEPDKCAEKGPPDCRNYDALTRLADRISA